MLNGLLIPEAGMSKSSTYFSQSLCTSGHPVTCPEDEDGAGKHRTINSPVCPREKVPGRTDWTFRTFKGKGICAHLKHCVALFRSLGDSSVK